MIKMFIFMSKCRKTSLIFFANKSLLFLPFLNTNLPIFVSVGWQPCYSRPLLTIRTSLQLFNWQCWSSIKYKLTIDLLTQQ